MDIFCRIGRYPPKEEKEAAGIEDTNRTTVTVLVWLTTMRFYCFVLLILTCGGAFAESLELISEPAGGRLVDFKVVGEDLFAAQRGNGCVLVSSDGGKTFKSTKVGGSKSRSLAKYKGKLYVSIEDKGIFESTDSGKTFEGPILTKKRKYRDLALAGGFLWLSTSSGLFKYDGEKFTPVPGIQQTQTIAGDGKRLAVAVGPVLFYSPDGGSIWKKIQHPAKKRINCLRFDAKTLLVGSEEEGLWKVDLTNFSVATTSLIEQFDNKKAHVVCIGKGESGVYTVGLRDQGLWISKDQGKSWTEVKDSEGKAPRQVEAFVSLDGQLYAGIGKGFWRLVP